VIPGSWVRNVQSDDLIGNRFGRYRIVDVIGRGGMATVYRAVLDGPHGFSRAVAIKQIRTDEESHSERFERALVNEAQLGSRLRHPNLVDVLEFGQQDGSFYIVMELVEGMTLARAMREAAAREATVPRKLCMQVLADVASGLAYAHAFQNEDGAIVGLIHRDLKPGNILVSHSGQVLVADFGLAKSDANVYQSTSVEVKGTPAYMSPEQVTCKPLTPASDLFSLGTILYELLRGEPLFAADNVLAVVNRVACDPLDGERQWVRSHAPEVAELFERLTAKDPADRPASADIVAREARELLRGYPAQVSLSDFMGWLGDDSADVDSLPDAGAYVPPTPTIEDTASVPSDLLGAVSPMSSSGMARRWTAGWTLALVATVVLGISAVLAGRAVWAPATDAEPVAQEASPPVADVESSDPVGPAGPAEAGSEHDVEEVSTGEVAPTDEPAPVETASRVEATPPVVAAAAEPASAEPAGRAPLKVDCRPWCDRIEVEGESWGESPQLKKEAVLGRREVRLFAARGEEKVLTVDVVDGGTKVCWDFDLGEPCEGF